MKHADLGEVTGHPVLRLLQCVALTICQRSIYSTLQQPNSPNKHEPCHSCTAGLTEQLNIPIPTAPHLELGVWEPSDPKQQRRAHRGRRGCEPVIVQTAQCASLGQPTHQMSKWDRKTRQEDLPLEIIEHDGVRHYLAEAGHRVELSDDLCAQTESQEG